MRLEGGGNLSYYVNKFSAVFDSVLLFEGVSYGKLTSTDR